MVKDCLINRSLPPKLGYLLKECEFIRYKINRGNVIGASLSIAKDNVINIKDFGFPETSESDILCDIESVVNEKLHYANFEKIRGARDDMAMKKNGNVFLIIDTDEIPMLDVSLIDDGYVEIAKGENPLAFFKRKRVARKYWGV